MYTTSWTAALDTVGAPFGFQSPSTSDHRGSEHCALEVHLLSQTGRTVSMRYNSTHNSDNTALLRAVTVCSGALEIVQSAARSGSMNALHMLSGGPCDAEMVSGRYDPSLTMPHDAARGMLRTVGSEMPKLPMTWSTLHLLSRRRQLDSCEPSAGSSTLRSHTEHSCCPAKLLLCGTCQL